jgi:hypothetical protein
MGNFKCSQKTLISQFLYHIFPVNFERVNFLVSYDTSQKKPVKLTGKSNKNFNHQKHYKMIEFKKDRIY